MGEETNTKKSSDTRFKPDEVIASQRNRQLMIVTALIALLAIPIAIREFTREDSGALQEQRLIGEVDGDPRFETEDVATVEVWKGKDGAKFTLKRDGEDWIIPAKSGAPASDSDVESLIQRVIDSKRFNKPGTNDQDQYVYYRLTEPEAAHLRLINSDGETLIHLLLGKSDSGSRDFVRLGGEDAPEGIFELTGSAGAFDTIYSALALNPDGEAQPKRWLDLSGFKALPHTAQAQRLTITDHDRVLVLEKTADAEEGDDAWRITSPTQGAADPDVVSGILDELKNYAASDIAGTTGFGIADAMRRITIEYQNEGKSRTTELVFGKVRDNNVAAQIKGAKYIFWAGDFILERIFRPTTEFINRERLGFLPELVDLANISMMDDGVTTELLRDETGAGTPVWKLDAPLKVEADYNAVSSLLRVLNGLQGYKSGVEQNREALKVGPGVSSRWLTIKYPEAHEAPDESEDEEADENSGDEESEAEEPPVMLSSTLYFGASKDGEVPVLMTTPEGEQLYFVAGDAVAPVFESPGSYAKTVEVKLLDPSQTIEEVQLTNADGYLQLVHEELAEGGGKRWQIKQPVDELADQSQVSELIRALRSLRAVNGDELNRDELGLGDDAKIKIDLRIKDGEQTRVASLRVGKTLHGLVSLLVKRPDGGEALFLAQSNDLLPLRHAPGDYRDLENFDVKVRQVLVSWQGKSPRVQPKDPARTETEARALADDIVQRARNGEDFVELQKKYNEDGDATAVYDVSPTAGLVKSFTRLSSELEVGETGMAESQFGLHIIKRIE